jgi:hypothetical protein
MNPMTTKVYARKDIESDLRDILPACRFIARRGHSGYGKLSALHISYVDRSGPEGVRPHGDLSVVLQVFALRNDCSPEFGEALKASSDALALEEKSNGAPSDSRLRRIDRHREMADCRFDPVDLDAWTFRAELRDGSSVQDSTRRGWATLRNVSPEAEIVLKLLPQRRLEGVSETPVPEPEPTAVAAVSLPTENAFERLRKAWPYSDPFQSRRWKLATAVLAASLLIAAVCFFSLKNSRTEVAVKGTSSRANAEALSGLITHLGGGADVILSKSDRPIYHGRIPGETYSRGRRFIVHMDQAPDKQWSVRLRAYGKDGAMPDFQRPAPEWGQAKRAAQRYEFFITIDADGDGEILNGSPELDGLFSNEELDQLRADSPNIPIESQQEAIAKALNRDLAGRNWNFHIDRYISLNDRL